MNSFNQQNFSATKSMGANSRFQFYNSSASKQFDQTSEMPGQSSIKSKCSLNDLHSLLEIAENSSQESDSEKEPQTPLSKLEFEAPNNNFFQTTSQPQGRESRTKMPRNLNLLQSIKETPVWGGAQTKDLGDFKKEKPNRSSSAHVERSEDLDVQKIVKESLNAVKPDLERIKSERFNQMVQAMSTDNYVVNSLNQLINFIKKDYDKSLAQFKRKNDLIRQALDRLIDKRNAYMKSVNTQAYYTQRLFDNLYKISLESRADWLTIEVISVCNHIGRPVSDHLYHSTAKKIHQVFQYQTESLAEKVLENEADGLSIGELADSVRLFYRDAMPGQLFWNIAQKRTTEDDKKFAQNKSELKSQVQTKAKNVQRSKSVESTQVAKTKTKAKPEAQIIKLSPKPKGKPERKPQDAKSVNRLPRKKITQESQYKSEFSSSQDDQEGQSPQKDLEQLLGRKKSAKVEKDASLQPKKGLCNYFIYRNDYVNQLRAQNIPITREIYMNQTRESWNAMTEQEKAPYDLRAQEDKLRYRRQLDELKQKGYFTLEDGSKSTEQQNQPKPATTKRAYTKRAPSKSNEPQVKTAAVPKQRGKPGRPRKQVQQTQVPKSLCEMESSQESDSHSSSSQRSSHDDADTYDERTMSYTTSFAPSSFVQTKLQVKNKKQNSEVALPDKQPAAQKSAVQTKLNPSFSLNKRINTVKKSNGTNARAKSCGSNLSASSSLASMGAVERDIYSILDDDPMLNSSALHDFDIKTIKKFKN